MGVWIVALIILSSSWVWASSAVDKPQRGGILTFAVGNESPTYDGHMEGTYGLIHPVSPHYSLLLTFDEDHYPRIVGDLAESWVASADKKTFTFKILDGFSNILLKVAGIVEYFNYLSLQF